VFGAHDGSSVRDSIRPAGAGLRRHERSIAFRTCRHAKRARIAWSTSFSLTGIRARETAPEADAATEHQDRTPKLHVRDRLLV
jgi:hypothetical protein